MPSPQSNHGVAVRIIREYEPDPARCVAALLKLLERGGTGTQPDEAGRGSKVER